MKPVNLISENSMIRLQFLSIDVKEGKCKISISGYDDNDVFVQRNTEAYLSRNIRKWLSVVKPRTIVNDLGEKETTYLTGYEMFSKKANIDNIIGHTFQCGNRSTDYYKNPFRVFINQKGTATIYSVTRPNPTVKVYRDPVTGEQSMTYHSKRTKEGDFMYLGKDHFLRFDIRSEHKQYV